MHELKEKGFTVLVAEGLPDKHFNTVHLYDRAKRGSSFHASDIPTLLRLLRRARKLSKEAEGREEIKK